MSRRSLVACVLTATLVTGCSSSLYDAPLPGGADLGDNSYRVTVVFRDVLDLVPQASVKVNDVAVGKVEQIGLAKDNSTALVHLVVNGGVRLPINADAKLRQSSLLGEKFVELGPPATENPTGKLRDGSVIPLSRTNRNPEVEEVLGALSLLLSGGGVGKLQGIIQELNHAFSGNEPEIRSLLSNVDEMVIRLDAQKNEINRAIDGLGQLSATLRSQTDNIATSLDHLAPGINTIEQQRGQLVTMLRSLDRLSGVAVDTVNKSKDDLVADLHALEPTLRKLADAGTNLPKAIGYLASYPFPEDVMTPLKGDFVNVDVDLDLDLSSIANNLSRSSGPLLPLPGISDSAVPAFPPKPTPPAEKPPESVPKPGDQLGGLLDDLLGGN